MTALPNKHIHRKATQRENATKEQLETTSSERNVDSRFPQQQQEDGGSSTRQSLRETSGLWWPTFDGKLKGIRFCSFYLLVNALAVHTRNTQHSSTSASNRQVLRDRTHADRQHFCTTAHKLTATWRT